MEPGSSEVSTTSSDLDRASERTHRLVDGARRLARLSPRPTPVSEHVLLAAAATAMVSGLLAIALGWLGAARSTLVEEQVPYLVSGGIGGLAVALLGGSMYFAHWLTVSIREQRGNEKVRRQEHLALMGAIEALRDELRQKGEGDAGSRSQRAQRPLRRAPSRS